MKSKSEEECDFILKMMKNLSVDTSEGKHLKRLARLYGMDIPEGKEGEWFSQLTDEEIRQIILDKIRGY